jgi:hypothetical protein
MVKSFSTSSLDKIRVMRAPLREVPQHSRTPVPGMARLIGAVVPFLKAASQPPRVTPRKRPPWVRNVPEWVTFEDGHVAGYHEELFDDTTRGLER